MRKLFLALAWCVAASGYCQVLSVKSIEKIDLPHSQQAGKVAAISPQGDYLLLTTDANTGLTKLDLNTHATTAITSAAGAGYEVKIAPSGQEIVYREKTQNSQHLSYTALKAVNLSNGSASTLVKPTRNLQGVAIEGATAVAVNNGKLAKKALGAAKAQALAAPVLSIQNRQLMITQGGYTRVFNPSGNQLSYLWPSLSPSGTKVLYYVGGTGAYVCNIDGTGVQFLGQLRAPVWYDDETVLGMNDKDDGEFIYASTIIASNLNGTQQALTGDDVIAMYPHASAASGKIAFSTPAGEVYIINVTK